MHVAVNAIPKVHVELLLLVILASKNNEQYSYQSA